MLNLNGDSPYVSLLIYSTRATGYFLQQINSGDEHAFCSSYQQYIACIDEFVTQELWSCTGGQFCGHICGWGSSGLCWQGWVKPGAPFIQWKPCLTVYDTAFLRVTNGYFRETASPPSKCIPGKFLIALWKIKIICIVSQGTFMIHLDSIRKKNPTSWQ